MMSGIVFGVVIGLWLGYALALRRPPSRVLRRPARASYLAALVCSIEALARWWSRAVRRAERALGWRRNKLRITVGPAEPKPPTTPEPPAGDRS